MRDRWKSLKNKTIDERSIAWLLLKGFGGALALGAAALAAYATIGIFNVSHTIRQSEELRTLRGENNILRSRIDQYEAKRFYMQPPLSSRILKPGLFLYYNGIRQVYTISTYTDTLIAETRVPLKRPDIFSFNDTTYMIFTEVLIDIQGVVGDTACFYFDIYNK